MILLRSVRAASSTSWVVASAALYWAAGSTAGVGVGGEHEAGNARADRKWTLDQYQLDGPGCRRHGAGRAGGWGQPGCGHQGSLRMLAGDFGGPSKIGSRRDRRAVAAVLAVHPGRDPAHHPAVAHPLHRTISHLPPRHDPADGTDRATGDRVAATTVRRPDRAHRVPGRLPAGPRRAAARQELSPAGPGRTWELVFPRVGNRSDGSTGAAASGWLPDRAAASQARDAALAWSQED